MQEEFKEIIGSDGLYAISKTGKIKSLRSGNIIKQCVTNRGYAQVHMSIKGKRKVKYVHRAVAECFIGDVYEEVDHIDGNTLNNNVENLRLCTRRENQLFCYKNKYPGCSYCSKSKRWRACISIGRKNTFLGSFDTPEEASEAYKRKKAELERKTHER